MFMVLYGLSGYIYITIPTQKLVFAVLLIMKTTPTLTHLEMEELLHCIASLLMQMTLSYIKL